MILQRLTEFYDRLAADPATANALPKPGYSLQKVSFAVVLDPDGTLNGFQSAMVTAGKKDVARPVLVPGQNKPSGQGINPCFLWDNSGYMFGYKRDDPNPERTGKTFEAFRDRHLDAEPAIASPAYAAVCKFLRDWHPALAADHATALENILGSFGVFRIAGEPAYVHDDPAVIAYWAGRSAATDGGDVRGLCLVTGREDVIARLHEPKIRGVRDAQTGGALLVSFNAKAYESYGKDQSYNAPVSAAATFRYTNALNYLLNRDDRQVTLGDATVTFWSEKPTQLEAFASDIFGGVPPPVDDAPADDKAKAEAVKRFLSQVRTGRTAGQAVDADNGIRFYVLGLSPNASRISVRFWLDSTVGALKGRLSRHMADTELTGGRPDDPPLVIRRIVQATGRAETDPRGRFKGYDGKAVSPLLAGAVAQAVLTGNPYPHTLLSAMLNRLRADGQVRHERVAAIKGCLIRSTHQEVSVALDPDRADPAYVTGRLFAILEKIQSDALAGLNATIKDRYFSAASATPCIVFPRLIRLSQHHLSKMEPGQKIYYERLVGQVVSMLTGFPAHLVLEDQGLFAVGYYHQRQDLFTKRPAETATAPEGDPQ